MAEQPTAAPIDLAALLESAAAEGAIWSHSGSDLNANLVLFNGDHGVLEHINDEVEVLVVALLGVGFVEIDGRRHRLAPGQLITIPVGARRTIGSAGSRFGYLTCHRRRAGLWPRGMPRPDTLADSG